MKEMKFWRLVKPKLKLRFDSAMFLKIILGLYQMLNKCLKFYSWIVSLQLFSLRLLDLEEITRMAHYNQAGY